jgi:hypothetical protein
MNFLGACDHWGDGPRVMFGGSNFLEGVPHCYHASTIPTIFPTLSNPALGRLQRRRFSGQRKWIAPNSFVTFVLNGEFRQLGIES